MTDYFNKKDRATLLKLQDFNEEFPFCCPEIAATLKIDKNTITLDRLSIKSFTKTERFFIWSINGSRLLCKTSYGSHNMGINAYSFPDSGYENLNIKSVDDVIEKHEKVFKYFKSWPTSPENGIPVKSSYDEGVNKCYIEKSAA